ncbi:uncharacterized protein LOC142775496 [Rhipicephalus microplus]|uniref:uncharacterized protein LOC142775496 n=1 Tax=Rhipicephalus microplus TaxID=6941 RepID=UPI003F6BA084
MLSPFKFSTPNLRPLTRKTSTHVRDSSHSVQLASDVSIDDVESLVSVDVISLVTNVPVPLAVSSDRAALAGDAILNEETPLALEELCRLLKFCPFSTYISHKRTIFRQNSGTVMVASISVRMANLTKEYIEEKTLSSFSPRPKLFLRYMNDCFCATKTSEIKNFRQPFDSVHPALQFWAEWESYCSIPFLDVQLARKRHGLKFSVHKEPTPTSRYLHFDSSHHARPEA